MNIGASRMKFQHLMSIIVMAALLLGNTASAAKPGADVLGNTPTSALTEISVRYDSDGNVIVDDKLINALGNELKNPDSVILTSDIPRDALLAVVETAEQKMLAPFEKELRNLGADNEARIQAGARYLCAWTNSREIPMKSDCLADNLNSLQAFLSREDIVSWVLTGEGLTTVDNDKGDPIILLVNCNEKMGTAFRDAIDWLQKNEAEDILDFFELNRVYIFCPVVYSVEDDLCTTYDLYGVIYANLADEKIEEMNPIALENRLKDTLLVESFGSAHKRLMNSLKLDYDWASAMLVKGYLGSYCYRRLFIETNTDLYRVYANKQEEGGILTAKWVRNGKVISLYTQKQLRWVTQLNLIKPLGTDNWDFFGEDFMSEYVDFWYASENDAMN